MRTRSVVVAASVIVLTLGLSASPGAAGGWAVSTLDELPELRPGATVDIGITVRSHGVNPMTVTGPLADGFGITFVAEDGKRSFFPAEPEGAEGHHVAAGCRARCRDLLLGGEWVAHPAAARLDRDRIGPGRTASVTFPVHGHEPAHLVDGRTGSAVPAARSVGPSALASDRGPVAHCACRMTTRAAVLGVAALVAAIMSVTSWSASRSVDEGQHEKDKTPRR